MDFEYTFEDYKRRISIRDILEDAGYSFNRKDGLRYPSYSRKDAEGRNIKGDKFIVTANGLCCFRPPEYKNYNIIGFIKGHPEMFPEYTPGKDLNLLVNEVCSRLLNVPLIQNRRNVLPYQPKEVERREFSMSRYSVSSWNENDYTSQKRFFPYFVDRGITRDTQKAFADHFFIVSNMSAGKNALQRLAFPMRIPGSSLIVGLQERGIRSKDGGSYKGMAQNSNATQGVWLASPKLDILNAAQLKAVRDVYWFESPYDAMAFYQLQQDKATLQRAVFVSTGGSPSLQQFKGMCAAVPRANHHTCFDRDMAGKMYAINFAIAKSGKDYSTHLATAQDEQNGIAKAGQLVVTDRATNEHRFSLNLSPFEYGRLTSILGVGKPDMKDYLSSLNDKADVRSGDYDLLPKDSLSGQLCSKLWTTEEKHNSGEIYEGVPPEQREAVFKDYEREAAATSKRMKEAIVSDVAAYRKAGGAIIYEPCKDGYKDWNDQLLDKPIVTEEQTEVNNEKKQMTSEDIIESSLDGTDGIYEERSASHEEKENEEETKEKKEQEHSRTTHMRR